MRDLYKIVHATVEPAGLLLKAVTEVNWHMAAAIEEGWGVTLSVDELGTLCVEVTRDIWPTRESEEEAS